MDLGTPIIQNLVGEMGDPIKTDIGAWRCSALWNRTGFDPPVVEVLLFYCDELWDARGAIRIFRDVREYREFIEGLRVGKMPVALGPEHHIYAHIGREACEQAGGTAWSVHEILGIEIPRRVNKLEVL